MGHMGDGAHGQWGTYGQGGTHGQWDTWAKGHMGKGVS